MTTNSEQTTAQAEPLASDYAEIWRAIGGLESTARALLEGQQELKLGLREVNRRIDRKFFAILGAGGALLASVYVSRFIGG